VIDLAGEADVDVSHQRRGGGLGGADGRHQGRLDRLDRSLAETAAEALAAGLEGAAHRVAGCLERIPGERRSGGQAGEACTQRGGQARIQSV